MYATVDDVEDATLLPAKHQGVPPSSLSAPPVVAPRRTFGILLRLLTALIWSSAILFGLFAAVHYLSNAATGHWTRWESTDPGLYRPSHPQANILMCLHMSAGCYLMLVGPAQLVPSIRRRYIAVHRWTGRLYIVAALLASLSATAFVLIFGTPRKNRHEDINNVCFGIAAATCAFQSYRHAGITKRIDLHKRWSWRLYGVIVGVLLYRFYLGLYTAITVDTSWHGSKFASNALFYTLFLPNLIVVEYIWHWKQDSERKGWAHVAVLSLALTVASLGLFVMASRTWLPAITGNSEGTVAEYKR